MVAKTVPAVDDEPVARLLYNSGFGSGGKVAADPLQIQRHKLHSVGIMACEISPYQNFGDIIGDVPGRAGGLEELPRDGVEVAGLKGMRGSHGLFPD